MYGRRDQEENLDTIRYEIDMLDYCYERYVDLERKQQTSDQGDLNAYLECFLLHYRNLVEFFSTKDIRKDETNLRIYLPLAWASGKLDVEETKQLIRRDLFDSVWQKISIYLAHCTTYRASTLTEWPVDEMYKELNKTLAQFEKVMHLDRIKRGGVPCPVRVTPLQNGASTATFTAVKSVPD